MCSELGMESAVQLRGGQTEDKEDNWCYLYSAQFLYEVEAIQNLKSLY